MKTMNFTLVTKEGRKELRVDFDKVLAIGFAGRDQVKAMEHIHELEKLGVKAPESIPVLYPVADLLVTDEDYIQVLGDKSSGEAEFLIILQGGKIYIGLGSDHTDRDLESVSIAKSKQICAKPLSNEVWLYDEVKDHWDELKLVSWQVQNEKEVKYQEGKVSEILRVEKIIEEVSKTYSDTDNMIMFSGTVPLLDGFVYGDSFRCELQDEVLQRKIAHEYKVEVLG
jgi:hypothetical protein